jgi:hypothetical protein
MFQISMIVVFSRFALKGQSGHKPHSRMACLGCGKEGLEQPEVGGIMDDDQIDASS